MHEPPTTDARLPFVALEPPPGGLPRLQREVRQRRHGTPRFHLRIGAPLAGASALALCALLALLLLPNAWSRHRQRQALTRAVQQVMSTATERITITHGAALAVPGGQDGVRVYLVESDSGAEAAPTPWPTRRPVKK